MCRILTQREREREREGVLVGDEGGGVGRSGDVQQVNNHETDMVAVSVSSTLQRLPIIVA